MRNSRIGLRTGIRLVAAFALLLGGASVSTQASAAPAASAVPAPAKSSAGERGTGAAQGPRALALRGSQSAQYTAYAVALSPDKSGVFQWEGGTTWSKIGGPAANLYAGFGYVLATNPQSGDVYLYGASNKSWSRIGGPGRVFVFAVAPDNFIDIFGLAPDGSGVFRHLGGTAWEKVGGPAGWIYGGGAGMFATNPQTGNIYQYSIAGRSWTMVGGPGKHFVVNDTGLYGLAPNGSAVYRWNGSGTAWTQWGGPAGWIFAGGGRLLATNPSSGDVYLNNGGANQWSRIGGPGSDFPVSSLNQIFGLSPDRSGVYVWNNGPWVQIGGPASVVVAE
ncbi:hypothetical protein [Lentzea kentuckyensis]|uniref:hypothetical protein n=1 Tax=Lentzea kentuckyensis TaxID=360086 RepID=UPI001179C67A|nr:hypothetical protein [Lentzea kentuckyensis]